MRYYHQNLKHNFEYVLYDNKITFNYENLLIVQGALHVVVINLHHVLTLMVISKTILPAICTSLHRDDSIYSNKKAMSIHVYNLFIAIHEMITK